MINSAAYEIPQPTEDRKSRKPLVWAVAPLALTLSVLCGAATHHDPLRYVLTGAVLGLVAQAVVVLIRRFAFAAKGQDTMWAGHSLAWYRAAYPEHVHNDGHIVCRHCKSDKVSVQGLTNKTSNMRAHVCGQCGKTLFFSPEQS